MRKLVFAFGLVAMIDLAADGQADLMKYMLSEAQDAFRSVTNGVRDGADYTYGRAELEISRPRP